MSDLFISRDKAESDLLYAAAFIGERINSADGRSTAMLAVVPRLSKRGEVDLAAELANAVVDPFSRDKLLTSVAEACASIDDDEYALQLADAVDDEGLRLDALERIALIKVEKGEAEAANGLAGQLLHPDRVQAASAVKAAADGNIHETMKDVAAISFPSSRVWALRAIASARVEAGETDAALKCLEQALIDAEEIEHDEERITSICEIGNVLVQAGRNDLAVKAFAAAREHTSALDNIHRDHLFSGCALGFIYAGDEDLADETLDLITDKTQIASTLVGFARDEWRRDQKEQAVETLDDAYQVLCSQREIETRDTRAKNALMSSVAVQYAGFAVPEKDLQAAEEITDPSERDSALSQIAQILSTQNAGELAQNALERIAEPFVRLETIIAMSDAKLRSNDDESAADLLASAAEQIGSLPQATSRSHFLNEVAARYFARGRADAAREAALQNLAVIADVRDESSQASLIADLSDLYGEDGLEFGDGEREAVARSMQKFA
ncbi:MAG: hypothetical protein HS105_08750 [Chloracidobacterium sp.]|nr:hypothetical protein [Chloracidobacterium sp.]MCO5333551.1 hypothetical protein [Pyrinomonadaceae bacterium]